MSEARVPASASRYRDVTLHEANELAYGCRENLAQPVALAGRVMVESSNGDLMLVTLRDGSGPDLCTEITCAIAAATDSWSPDRWRDEVSLGDHVSITGVLTLSNEHDPLLRAGTWSVLSKAVRPFSTANHKGRTRHTDLLLDPEARGMLLARTRVVASLRETLEAEEFVEIETPMLELATTQKSQRPFRTRCDSLDVPVHLRTSSEYYLKRLFAAGFDRVFELARSFRDEKLDATHNIEYSLLEAYRAYDDYVGMRQLAQELIRSVAMAALGTTVVAGPRGEVFDLRDEWAVMPIHTAVSRAVGENITPDGDSTRLHAIARDHGLPIHEMPSDDHLVLGLYERLVEPETARPTFYTDFPRALAPLALTHRTQSRLAQKWDLVIFGREIAAAYSELVDPAEQRAHLRCQQPSSPEDLKPVDMEFLDALDVGVPPTAGLVVGVDRLVMTLTGATDIRQVIPFPLATPH